MFEAVSRKEFLILEARFRSLASQSEICDRQRGTKFGHTLSSRNVSSCDVTRAVGMWEAIMNSMAQIHTSVTLLTSRDLTCQHASHISVVPHISWDVTYKLRAIQALLSAVCRKKYIFCRRLHWTDTTGMLSPPTTWRQKRTWDNVTWWYTVVPPHMTWAHVTWAHVAWAHVAWAHVT
jgi:hypothetical protein